jgi:hypothetical protein
MDSLRQTHRNTVILRKYDFPLNMKNFSINHKPATVSRIQACYIFLGTNISISLGGPFYSSYFYFPTIYFCLLHKICFMLPSG